MLGKPRPRMPSKRIQYYVLERDDFTCQYCGDQEGPFVIHHVHPWEQGGSNHPKNLRTICTTCHPGQRTVPTLASPLYTSIKSIGPVHKLLYALVSFLIGLALLWSAAVLSIGYPKELALSCLALGLGFLVLASSALYGKKERIYS